MTADINRKHPRVEVTHWSPNFSSRAGARPTLIVVHATAGHNRRGLSDLTGLGSWFGSTASAVSSHVATDNEAHSARFVRDGGKAWHVAGYNRMALGIEQVIPGDGTEITENLYRETARWIAYWGHLHGIPVVPARTSGGYVQREGVCTHQSLGAIGGNHNDPGPRFSMSHLLDLSRYYRKKGY